MKIKIKTNLLVWNIWWYSRVLGMLCLLKDITFQVFIETESNRLIKSPVKDIYQISWDKQQTSLLVLHFLFYYSLGVLCGNINDVSAISCSCDYIWLFSMFGCCSAYAFVIYPILCKFEWPITTNIFRVYNLVFSLQFRSNRRYL